MYEGGNVQREMSVSWGGQCPFPGALVFSTDIVAVDLVCDTLTTVDRVVDECTKFITHWSRWRKKLCGLNKEQEAQLSPRDRAMRRVS